MESDEDDEIARELADQLDAVAAYVELMNPPEELEIKLEFIKGMVALENYLEGESG